MRYINTRSNGAGLSGMLRSDIRRFFSIKKLLTAIFLICFICLLSVSDHISPDLIGAEEIFRSSIVDSLQSSLIFDRFKPLLALAASLCVAPEFAYDYNNQYLRYLLVRGSLTAYVVSRILVGMVFIILVTICGFVLAGIFMLPLGVIHTKGWTTYGIYQKMVSGDGAWFYLILMAGNFALSVVPFCNIGIIMSVWKPDLYVALGSSFLSFYLVYSLTNRLPFLFCYNSLSSEPGMAAAWMLPYQAGAFLLLILLTGAGIYHAVLRRYHEGTF